ncbi:MAG TPA: transposase [Usitatibacter sp.]|nr:transposase [Usitatibacter sp.]
MPRLPRNFLSEVPVHLVHRGNNRQKIFLCDGDYLAFRRFADIARTTSCVSVHSYVLMPNHVHLLVTARTCDGISKFIQSLARRYVGYFNACQGRTGTLWEGRFHSATIATDHYLFACHRYIDMNPVRAGLVRGPADYPWSSHRFYSRGSADILVTPHSVIEGLARDEHARREAYQRLFAESPCRADLDAIRVATLRRRALTAVSDTS